MTCIDAQATLSAAHDRETVAAADLAAAREHCANCPECSSFEAGLRYLDLLPVPSAPDGLIERVMGVIAPLAAEQEQLRLLEAERDEADSVGSELPVPETSAEASEVEALPAPEPAAFVPFVPAAAPSAQERFLSRFPWFVGPVRWATYGAAAALAASALIAFVVVGMQGGPSPANTASSQSQAPLDLTFSGQGNTSAPPAAGAAPAPAQAPVPASAPDYVIYKDFVYAPGALLADSSSATPTIGTLLTAFAAPGAPQSVTVFRSPLTDGSIVVKGPDGLRLFTPVTRMMSSVRYQLTSGKPIDRFGTWPVLPDRFPAPTNSAGTPSFVAAGTDSLGVTVFSATGRPVTEGFAIAPGTPTSDPAAGNPNWTWWSPAPATP
jgi:hypothetical protein